MSDVRGTVPSAVQDSYYIMNWLLSEKDVATIASGIFPGQMKARTLRRLLQVPKATVDSIFQEFQNPEDRLIYFCS